MRLLLLGCTGFIGRELIPKLLASGNQLTVISRKSPRNFHSSDKLTYLKYDLTVPDNWEKLAIIQALEQAEGIINLAGEPITEKRWTKSHREKIKQSRLSTTQGLIDGMKKSKNTAKVLINASAIGFYGTSQEDLFTEENPSGKDFLANVCSQWEEIALKKPNSTRLIILRIGIVLGPDGGALGKMLPIFRAGFGGPIGTGTQWMSWIHRTDLCQIIEESIVNKSWNGVINAVAPEPSKMSKFSESLAKVLGRPSLLPVPGPLLKLLLGDGAKVVLEGQNVVSKRLNRLKFQFKYPKLNQALEAINK